MCPSYSPPLWGHLNAFSIGIMSLLAYLQRQSFSLENKSASETSLSEIKMSRCLSVMGGRAHRRLYLSPKGNRPAHCHQDQGILNPSTILATLHTTSFTAMTSLVGFVTGPERIPLLGSMNRTRLTVSLLPPLLWDWGQTG